MRRLYLVGECGAACDEKCDAFGKNFEFWSQAVYIPRLRRWRKFGRTDEIDLPEREFAQNPSVIASERSAKWQCMQLMVEITGCDILMLTACGLSKSSAASAESYRILGFWW